MLLVLSVAAIAGAGAAVEEYVPLYFLAVDISAQMVPILLLVGIVAGVVVSWFAPALEGRSSALPATLTLLSGLILVVGSRFSTLAAVASMILFISVLQVCSLSFQSSLQHEFVGSSRATLGSLPTLLDKLWATLLIGVYGVAALGGTDVYAVQALALVVALSALALVWAWARAAGPNTAAVDGSGPA